MIKLAKEGYVFISENGFEYELLEGMSIGAEPRYTSDIIFVFFCSPNENTDNALVGYYMGAGLLAEHLEEYEKAISKMVEEFEEKNFGKK